MKHKCKKCDSYYPHHFPKMGVCALIGLKVRGSSIRGCWRKKRRAK